MHGWYALRTPPSASPSGANKSRGLCDGACGAAQDDGIGGGGRKRRIDEHTKDAEVIFFYLIFLVLFSFSFCVCFGEDERWGVRRRGCLMEKWRSSPHPHKVLVLPSLVVLRWKEPRSLFPPAGRLVQFFPSRDRQQTEPKPFLLSFFLSYLKELSLPSLRNWSRNRPVLQLDPLAVIFLLFSSMHVMLSCSLLFWSLLLLLQQNYQS